MAITVVGTASATATSAASYNVTLPVCLEGDLVVVAYGISNSADAALGVNTAGYTEVANLYADDSHDTNLAVAYKLMGATPDSVVNVAGPSSVQRGGVAVVTVLRGVHQSTPIDVTTTTATGVNDFVPNPPSITPTTAGAFILAVGAASGTLADAAGTAPSGYSNQVANSIAGTTDSFMAAMASKAWTSGAEDPGSFTDYALGTASAGSWAAATLAIRPAVAPGTLGAEWTFIDPLANCTASQVSGNLELSIPSGGTTHDLFNTNQNAPIVYQASSNTDFEIQTKYVGDLTVSANENKGAGIVVFGANTSNCVSFAVASTTTGGLKVRSFAQSIASDVSTSQHFADLTTNLAQSFYMAVNRTGDVWTFYTSFDGITWTQKVQFTQALTVSKVGLYATNAGASPPAHLAKFDYFLVDTPRIGVSATGAVTEAQGDIVSGTGNVLVYATGVVREDPLTPDYVVANVITQALSAFPDFRPRVRETSTTTGLGPYTLLGAYNASYQSIASVYAANAPFYCVMIAEDTGSGWQEGLAHISDTGELVFDTISFSSNSNDFVTFGAGRKHVILDATAGFINDLVAKVNELNTRLTAAGF